MFTIWRRLVVWPAYQFERSMDKNVFLKIENSQNKYLKISVNSANDEIK